MSGISVIVMDTSGSPLEVDELRFWECKEMLRQL